MRTSLQDRLAWFSEVAALRPLMVLIIDRVQHLPGQFQIYAAGITFYCLCKGAGVDPHEMVTRLQRMERDVDAPFANQFQAMLNYAKGELRHA